MMESQPAAVNEVSAPVRSADTAGGGADLLELLLVLAREKKRILQGTLGAAVTLLATIIVFVVPKTYTAIATILPPQQNQSVLSAMLGQMAGAQTLDLRDLGLKNPSDVFVAMLQSRTVEDALVNRFDLRKVYNVKRYQDARKVLEKRSEIDPEKEGLISIQVTDRDPKRAADIANAWVDELRVLNLSMALTEAAQRRVFFEQKLTQERDDLAKAELDAEANRAEDRCDSTGRANPRPNRRGGRPPRADRVQAGAATVDALVRDGEQSRRQANETGTGRIADAICSAVAN